MRNRAVMVQCRMEAEAADGRLVATGEAGYQAEADDGGPGGWMKVMKDITRSGEVKEEEPHRRGRGGGKYVGWIVVGVDSTSVVSSTKSEDFQGGRESSRRRQVLLMGKQ